MNYESYWLDGMGLHSSQLKHLEKIITENGIKTIVEFGSGNSTKFFVDLREEKNLNYKIYSFDNYEHYAYKGTHDFLKLNISEIINCSDESFNEMFETKTYNKDKFVNCQIEKDNFRVENSFYDITSDDLPDNIDLVLLDGPNGNGRSISFLHLQNKLSEKSFILIDDSDHHDFIERCQQVLDAGVIIHEKDSTVHPLFNYAIMEVQS
tara:strand:+ start:974 stop:1597 length:624 start_codon:yes stop_codon:yes gene_type:complete